VKNSIVSNVSIKRLLSSKTSDSIVDPSNPTADRVPYITQRHDYNNKVRLDLHLYNFEYGIMMVGMHSIIHR